MSSGVPAVSLIVPTRDREASLVRLLDALRRQHAADTSFEVVVVLDGGAGADAQRLRRRGEDLRMRVIAQPQRGRAAACNRGAQDARGEILIFLDDDMEPAEGFLAAHRAAHGAPDEPRATIGAAPIRPRRDDPPIVRYRAEVFDRKLARLARSAGSVRPLDGYTGNFSVGRRDFLTAGGFDEAFATYGNEDFDLLARLREDGVTITFSAEALAIQWYDKNAAALARDTLAEGENAVRLARKQPALAPELYLARFLRLPRRSRLAFQAASGLAMRRPALIERVIRRIHPAPPMAYERLRKRFDRTFDFLYWHGADRAFRALTDGQDGRLADWLRSVSTPA